MIEASKAPDLSNLSKLKEHRYNQIDGKTSLLIQQGFTYDNMSFSLSLPAQTNWHAIKNQPSEFTFPVTISTADNNTYDLAQSSVSAFWQEGKQTLKGHIDSGRALKKQIFDATTIEQVNSVIDNR
jgi:hypothetical protein